MLTTQGCQSSGAENGYKTRKKPHHNPHLSVCFLSLSVPHFKLPLLGSGHRIISAPLVRCGTLKSLHTQPPLHAPYISHVCVFTDHLRSHVSFSGHSVSAFLPSLSLLCLYKFSMKLYFLFNGSNHMKTDSLKSSIPVRYNLWNTTPGRRGLIFATVK